MGRPTDADSGIQEALISIFWPLSSGTFNPIEGSWKVLSNALPDNLSSWPGGPDIYIYIYVFIYILYTIYIYTCVVVGSVHIDSCISFLLHLHVNLFLRLLIQTRCKCRYIETHINIWTCKHIMHMCIYVYMHLHT